MKFIPLPMSDEVTSALNFDTNDCHVLGGCDLYTTKAAGADKKLYRSIENSLESQYTSLVELSGHLKATLSPSRASEIVSSLDLARTSPFGSLSESNSRRTYAYLIATLNASHADYDFSNLLKPSDFRREKSLRGVVNFFDSTMNSLRPRLSTSAESGSFPKRWSPYSHEGSSSFGAGADVPDGTQLWDARKWQLIDREMDLKDCDLYSYSPEDGPFADDDGALWCINYFFFNKARKRVCYLYLRGLSMISLDPPDAVLAHRRNRASINAAHAGAAKRASYWFGDRADALAHDDEEEDEDFSDSDIEMLETSSGTPTTGDATPRKAPPQQRIDHRRLSDEMMIAMGENSIPSTV